MHGGSEVSVGDVSHPCVSGEEARRVHDEALKLLNRLIDSRGLQARGLVGFWAAQSDGDDIHLYADDVTAQNTTPVATFYGLRQQVRGDRVIDM